MTTENTEHQNQQPQGEQNAPPQSQGQQQSQQPGPVPYERFKAVNEELKGLKDKLAALEKDQNGKQQAENDLAARLQKLETDLATERQTNLRLSVATAKGLPAELVDRLRGETREALEQDADSLLALMKPKGGPGVPPPGGRAAKLDISGMTPAEIRKARAEGKL